ncbi:hypothetical protein ASPZODRAFT_162566 [Penicilliopsis zonata CBS 506.65]|uniref:Guanine deaminase n=1 Tax=Penicilliopsis zonata CBS 506.65 TaxID=1073090 RepID=A0A1L9STS8_9EURO|nr:hypothetical protein ASPZODRAFT_162566 [Penicilliopsis zonata CBS 506.65]OJJ50610.1 hypothetical protein ASPZODRAFT_162566 [Penicilliopsis zonata CBS 506.65]
MAPAYTVFYGTFIDLPRSITEEKLALDINHGTLWVSSVDGRIKGFDWTVHSEKELEAFLQKEGWVEEVENMQNGVGPQEKVKIVRAREDQNEFFFPGFIDTHIHAPQYPNSGLFGSSTLLDWLERYTFPLESSFGQKEEEKEDEGKEVAPPRAHTAYKQVISRTLSHGTTCASYFATIHVPATSLLASLCHARGQRAFIGRVCMDNPAFCPDYYRDASAEESLARTEAIVSHIHTLDPKGTLVKPILTPRFAPTCSPAALSGLGHLAASYSPPLHIQTHISENVDEVKLVKKLFPEATNYADVYDRFDLLTRRTILAHAVHLTPDERRLIHSRQAKVSHCPASNSALGSGICPVRVLLDDGITVGLGTDVSGGYSPSILEAVRQACLVSRLLGHTLPAEKQTGREKLSVEEALYLATRGGAAVVDMAGEIGGFEEGMFFDAQLIGLGSPLSDVEESADLASGNVDLFGWESWPEKIHKWVWTGDDRNVGAVWVNGRLVHARE